MTPLGDDSPFSSAQSSGSLVQTISCSFQHLVQYTSFRPNADTLWRFVCSASLFVMQNPIKERIAKLREEIAQISEANRLYMGGGKKMPASVGDHERRLQRLQEILDELVSLTDWKK